MNTDTTRPGLGAFAWFKFVREIVCEFVCEFVCEIEGGFD